MNIRRPWTSVSLALCLLAGALGALVQAGSASAQSGGSVVVLESAAGSFPNLDPATNTSDYADVPMMDAIYGDLFDFAAGGRVVPDLASGYKFTDGGKAVVITLRKGVKFSDGTPFNADAVAFNIRRDLEPQFACMCAVNFPVASVTTPNSLTVVMHLTKVYAPIMQGFYGAAPNWIVSPTALQKMGEKAFGLTPVGAGPFTVVSDIPNTKLVLKRNPTYFEKGHPFIDSLTFTAITSDETAYEALLSGQAQTYQAASTFSLIDAARKHVTVTPNEESLAPDGLQFNTTVAPFNNILAREAVYYATDPGPINKSILSGTGVVTQTPTIPGGLFSEPRIAGYRTYNLAKAKALVKQLGGLHFSLSTGNVGAQLDISEALKGEWAQAGISASIMPDTLQSEVDLFLHGGWEMAFSSLGGYDPPIGMGTRYASTGSFSGIKDPKLDSLLNAVTSTVNRAAQDKAARALFEYINEKAYTPFLFVSSSYNLTVHSVSGPGLTTTAYQAVRWQDVKDSAS